MGSADIFIRYPAIMSILDKFELSSTFMVSSSTDGGDVEEENNSGWEEIGTCGDNIHIDLWATLGVPELPVSADFWGEAVAPNLCLSSLERRRTTEIYSGSDESSAIKFFGESALEQMAKTYHQL